METFYLGAFLTKASTAADVGATAQLYKQGASGSSSSSAFQEHHLGKAAVCSGVDQASNTAPVGDCKARVGIGNYVPGRPGNYVVQEAGGGAAGLTVVPLVRASTYARTQFGLGR